MCWKESYPRTTWSYPSQHDAGNENTWPQPLEQDIGQWLKDRVRDEEDGQCRVVLVGGHAEILGETVNFGISDIRTADKREINNACRYDHITSDTHRSRNEAK